MPVEMDSTPPAFQAIRKYLPLPREQRAGIGLCLSGGGFRATLFHLGALRRLNEFGLIGKLRTVSAVSGGSIMAAHLASVIRAEGFAPDGRIADFEARVAEPIREFTRRGIRNRIFLSRLQPRNWLDFNNAVRALERIYRRELTPLMLLELPAAPNFAFCATNMAFGCHWFFERTRVGDRKAGFAAPPPADLPVARAIAASSCFPPVFNPMPFRDLGIEPQQLVGGAFQGPNRDALIRGMRLTDGGNYDNLGLEPVWRDHEVVLVSDGGATFDFEADRGLFRRLQRYTEILGDQAHATRKRWLISNFLADVMDGTYWGISSDTTSYDPGARHGYSPGFADEVIAQIRTDLDAFSPVELQVLENHGYLLADIAVRTHLRGHLGTDPPLALPYELGDESELRRQLRGSDRRRAWRRGA